MAHNKKKKEKTMKNMRQERKRKGQVTKNLNH